MTQPEPQLQVDARLLWRAAGGLAVVMTVAALAGIFLREPITAVARVFIENFGWGGVFVGVLFTDASPFPLTHEPILLLAVAMDRDPWTIGAVAAAASVTAGPVGWLGGTLLRTRGGAASWIEQRSPGMILFLGRWGATGVAVAALLPIPFALATWTAGLCAVPFGRVLAASTLRVPKTLFYLWVVQQGWALGAG